MNIEWSSSPPFASNIHSAKLNAEIHHIPPNIYFKKDLKNIMQCIEKAYIFLYKTHEKCEKNSIHPDNA